MLLLTLLLLQFFIRLLLVLPSELLEGFGFTFEVSSLPGVNVRFKLWAFGVQFKSRGDLKPRTQTQPS